MSEEAKKSDYDKEDLSQVPPSFRKYAAKAFMFGEKKYGRYNWRKGFRWHRLYSALNRHLDQWWEKEDLDPESRLHHLSHAAACLAMLIEHVDKNLGEDDRV